MTDLNNTKINAKELGSNIKEKSLDEGQEVKDQVINARDKAVNKAKDVKSKILEWVNSNPGKSLGLTCLTGWIFLKKIIKKNE